MQRLFGTDGVRGKAGVYPLDHETVARLGAALVRAMRALGARGAGPSAPVHHRPRHARVGRLDRARARPRRPRGRGRDHDRRRHSHARDRLHHARARLRRRAGDQRVAQSVRGQRHQGLLRPRREVHRHARAARRIDHRRHELAGARRRPAGGRADRRHRRLHRAHAPRAAGLRTPDDGRRSRSRIDTANGATTTVAPRLFRELGFDVTVIGDRAGRAQHQPRLRLDSSRAAERARPRRRLPHGRGVRRRRRSRDLRRSRRDASSTATPSC